MELEILKKYLEEFEKYFKESPIKEKSGPYNVKGRWDKDQIPLADKAGVYVYLIDKEVVYIGKSERELGIRVCSHLGVPIGPPNNRSFPYHQWSKWGNHPDSNKEKEFQNVCKKIEAGEFEIITINVNPGSFAPALESFLLKNGKTLLNIMG